MSTPPVPQVAGPGRAESGPPGENHGEVAELRTELREARETIEAIQGGGVDSLVIGPPARSRSTPGPAPTAPTGSSSRR